MLPKLGLRIASMEKLVSRRGNGAPGTCAAGSRTSARQSDMAVVLSECPRETGRGEQLLSTGSMVGDGGGDPVSESTAAGGDWLDVTGLGWLSSRPGDSGWEHGDNPRGAAGLAVKARSVSTAIITACQPTTQSTAR